MNERPISVRAAYVVRLISFPYRCVSSAAGGREPSLSALSLLDRSDHFREKSTDRCARVLVRPRGTNAMRSDMCRTYAGAFT